MADILVTGGTGQLGAAILAQDWPRGVRLLAPRRDELDLLDPAALEAYVDRIAPAAVINCAAYTAVDKSESDVVAAWRVNALAPAALAAACARANLPIVQISTDFVFDGAGAGYYDEDAAVGPLGVYGASKLGGECAVRTAAPRHVILRTAWVVSAHGQNFLKTMLRVGALQPELGVVDDQTGCPTSAADLAGAVRVVAMRLIEDATAPTGTYHVVNAGEATWHGLACEIFARAKAWGGPQPRVNAITTAQYPTPARRPANSRLTTAKFTRDYGVSLRPWPQAIAEIVDQLAPGRP